MSSAGARPGADPTRSGSGRERQPARCGLQRLAELGQLGLVREAELESARADADVRSRQPSERRARAVVSAGSTGELAALGRARAPAQRAARSAARTDMPLRTIRRARRRRSSWSGTASTARACSSVSCPLDEREDVLGRSSSRSRFDTLGLERPTRSATRERQPELVEQRRVGAGLLDGREVLAGDILDEREERRVSVLGLPHDGGDRRQSGRPAARQRRSPAISS